MTVHLVTERGAGQAGEELRTRINPMFEAVAGQVFHKGGSVIRFLGDGFLAWFGDGQTGEGDVSRSTPAPGIVRAIATGLEMQKWMRFFPHLRLKVFISMGRVHRWAIGDPTDRVFDVISGPAVRDLAHVSGAAQPGQVLLHANTTEAILGVGLETAGLPEGHWIVGGMPDSLAAAARLERWPAWQSRSDAEIVLNSIRPFVEYAVRAQIESGLAPEAGSLRLTVPLFLEVGLPEGDEEQVRGALDHCVRALQAVLVRYGGRLMSVETPGSVCVLFAVLGLLSAAGESEGDAERAIRAALEFQSRIGESFGEEYVRGGISRGLLYAGTVGGEARHDFSIIGDETNTASRLMNLAAPGQILVSEAVRDASGPLVRLRALEPMNVKGRQTPLPVFAVERAAAGRLVD
jgi:class 3 adenylate cyclase